MTIDINKLNTLKTWLETGCALRHFKLQPLRNEASFRQYFRIEMQNGNYIVMFAPPDKEDITAFIAIAKNFSTQGIHTPKIFNYDLEQGFVLLSDLGNALYFNLLNIETADDLYTRALAVIPQIQSCEPKLGNNMPLGLFDEKFIRTELKLFSDWFLQKHLKFDINPQFNSALEKVFQLLVTSALEQPHACVHRDYHSRNLLLVNKEKVGVLDFQDAIYGPITYDAVSLLRDAYIDWPETKVQQWALNFRDMLTSKAAFSEEQFICWFDLMGVQRHLKVLGIFARLCYRDNKPHYLFSTARLLRYLQQVSEKYPELFVLKNLLLTINNKLSET